jgi:hypothetical protein
MHCWTEVARFDGCGVIGSTSGLKLTAAIWNVCISDFTNVKLSYYTESETLHIAMAMIAPFTRERRILPTRRVSTFLHRYRHGLGILPAALVVCVIHISLPVRTVRRSDRALVVCVVNICSSLRTVRRSDRALVASAHVHVGIERQPMLGWPTVPL